MKHFLALFSCLFGLVLSVNAQESFPSSRPSVISYTLLDGSYFVDDCQICGRPTILQPLHGTFDLVLVQNTPPVTRYAVRNLEFAAAPGFGGEVKITGDGTYTRFDEFGILQNMILDTQVKNAMTNRSVVFTNTSSSVEQPFPLISISLLQSNGSAFQTFSMELLAAPLREVWFSTTKPFTISTAASVSNQISPGDLISNRGRVVRRNIDLVGRLGVMPIVPDLGLDAVEVTRRGEILFSIPRDVWSETLGQIGHGDLLSDRGRIVKKNRELLAAFGGSTVARPDAGLDAVAVMPDGEILFSIQSNVVVNAGLTLSRGDILSDRGYIFRKNRELLAKFQPAVTNYDYGLNALHVLPSGEIWFSVEEGFTDRRLGEVRAGDLLSNLGHRVFSNSQLLAAFTPSNPSQDYGLDALFIVTDTKLAAPPPRIVKLQPDRASGRMQIEWDGEGAVFQLQRTKNLAGPWVQCGPIQPDLIFDDSCDLTNGDFYFYRVQQW
jgi:hypothetical protein